MQSNVENHYPVEHLNILAPLEGVSVGQGNLIKLSIVYAYSDTIVVLLNWYQRECPRALTFHDQIIIN